MTANVVFVNELFVKEVCYQCRVGHLVGSVLSLARWGGGTREADG